QSNWKIERHDLTLFQQSRPRRQWAKAFAVGVIQITGFRRTEDAFDVGVVIKKRKENGDTLNNCGPQFWLNSRPILMEPPLYSVELVPLRFIFKESFIGLSAFGLPNVLNTVALEISQ